MYLCIMVIERLLIFGLHDEINDTRIALYLIVVTVCIFFDRVTVLTRSAFRNNVSQETNRHKLCTNTFKINDVRLWSEKG